LQLQDVVAQLRRQMIQAQEDERRRVASDLHDEAGHALTTAIFRLDLEMAHLPPDAREARATLDRARDSLLECAMTLHSIAFALRPRILEDLGLGAALRSLAAQTMEVDAVQVGLTIEGEEQQLDETVELTVFRIVQEALTNVRKHARATQVWVRLTYGRPQLTVTIEDDGVGLDTPNVTPGRQSGLGLVGMYERLQTHGGRLEIGGREGGGARLVARLPLL
jgi:signal transduction histidine kinase